MMRPRFQAEWTESNLGQICQALFSGRGHVAASAREWWCVCVGNTGGFRDRAW
jgi:hypothetical protein